MCILITLIRMLILYCVDTVLSSPSLPLNVACTYSLKPIRVARCFARTSGGRFLVKRSAG